VDLVNSVAGCSGRCDAQSWAAVGQQSECLLAASVLQAASSRLPVAFFQALAKRNQDLTALEPQNQLAIDV